MTKILVTGALGNVGRQLCRDLLTRSDTVVLGVDLPHHPLEPAYATLHPSPLVIPDVEEWESPFSYRRCDVSEYRQISQVIHSFRPDVVFHLAANFGRWSGEHYYEDLWRSNVVGTRHLLNLQEEFPFRMVFFSSSEIYGDSLLLLRESITEYHPTFPLSDYGISKLVGELQMRNWRYHELIIVRLFNVYGKEIVTPWRSTLSVWCWRALQGRPLIVYPGHERSWLYVDDCTSALTRILDLPASTWTSYPHKVYNIGSPSGVLSMEELAKIVSSVARESFGLSVDVQYREGKEPLTAVTKRIIVKEAQRDLSLRETVPLNEGIYREFLFLMRYRQVLDFFDPTRPLLLDPAWGEAL